MVPGETSAVVAAPQPRCPRARWPSPSRRPEGSGSPGHCEVSPPPRGRGENGEAVAALKRYLRAAAIASVTCPHPPICHVFANTRLYNFFINAFNHESPSKRVSFKQLKEDSIKLACNTKPERAEGSRELGLVAFAFRLASRAQWMQLLGLWRSPKLPACRGVIAVALPADT